MKYIDEFREAGRIRTLVNLINQESDREYRFMEVCGSHTHAILKHGIPPMLPDNIRLLSGPGCPVCVSPKSYIDRLIYLSGFSDVIIASYGDLLRVPGSGKSLQKCREEGADIRVVYSCLQALKIAETELNKKVVFAGIGFETTSPATAIAIMKAKQMNLRNFMVLSAHKLMPPAMQAVIEEGAKIDGYICPGHVSTITGSGIYDIFPQKYGVAAVISGFEPVDILLSILMLIRQINSGKFQTEIQYTRAVKPEGNTKARNLLKEVFNATESEWRGMGFLPASGLSVKTEFSTWDAEKQFDFQLPETKPDSGCICGEILKGLKNPDDCSLFGTSCKPESPAGACMVSSEGTCNAWYTWKRTDKEYNKDTFRRLYRVIDGDERKVYE